MDRTLSMKYAPPQPLYHGTTVLTSETVVLPSKVTAATLIICQRTGRIVQILESRLPRSDFLACSNYVDYGHKVLMPGLVDTHAHLNEPGRTSSEGFFTGTQAAASGGITTLIDMPLNSIPATTSVRNLRTKVRAAQSKCWVDVGFMGGIIPGNTKELKPLVKAGVRGFKGFLIDSDVDEFPMVTPKDVQKAMAELAHQPTMLMFHAEMLPAEDKTSNTNLIDSEDPPFLYPTPAHDMSYEYSAFLASRPPVFETTAVGELIALAKRQSSPLPIHVAHVSTAEVLPLIRDAQREGVNISAETCFHYLSFSAEEVALRDTRFKAEPPIRNEENRLKLWSSLRHEDSSRCCSGRRACEKCGPVSPLLRDPISMVVSDHSPCSPEDKLLPSYIPPHAEPPLYHNDVVKRANGDFFRAWGGISSLGLGLPILWTELNKLTMQASETNTSVHDGPSSISLETQALLLQVSQWLSSNPARLVGLERQKGRLEVGFDGDVLVFDPQCFWTVESADMKFKHKMSPYQGRTMKGRVTETWLRGQNIYSLHGENGGFVSEGPRGELLLEPRSHRGGTATTQGCKCDHVNVCYRVECAGKEGYDGRAEGDGESCGTAYLGSFLQRIFGGRISI